MTTALGRLSRPAAALRLALALALCAGCGTDGKPGGTGAETNDASAGTNDAGAEHQLVCAAAPTSVAYQAKADASAGVASVSAVPGAGLTPCFQLTGYATSETSLAVRKDGTLIVAPVITAEGTGVLRSKNKGAAWEVVLPATRGGAAHGRVQPYMQMDPANERLFFVNSTSSSSQGFLLSTSDDAGETWQKGTVGAGTSDWIKLSFGPPVTSTLAGYPSVVYASAPNPISTGYPDHQQVLRSLDGGQSWSNVAGNVLPLKAAESGCDPAEWVIYGGGVVGKDGSLYLGLRRCAHVGIAVSRDEGATWDVRDLPGSTLVAYGGLFSHYDLYNLMVAEPLAIDSDGNLYALWNDANNVLSLSVSRDRAATWSTPVAVAQPTLTYTVFADLDVKQPGTVAIAYYGSDDAGQTFGAYVAESSDALAAEPSFLGVRLNAASEPLFGAGFDLGYRELLTGGDLVEIIQVKYGPDGDIWSAFAKDMCPGQDRTRCTWLPEEHVDGTYQLAIGRVTHAK